jgi:hypothetical protein
MMQHCWLGETPFDYPFTLTDLPKAIAIQINGNDHFIRDTIVFSSKIGLEVNGAADYISGVHVWFPSNQALRFVEQGVMAFHITEGNNRFDGCYIDGSRAVFEVSSGGRRARRAGMCPPQWMKYIPNSTFPRCRPLCPRRPCRK